jgi:hypothetical protein
MSRCADLKGFTTVAGRNNFKPANKQNQNSSIVKFCSVCKNAGKDEKLYTSHFPKSSNGPDAVVVCPTILSNECSYCHKLGHFKQQCPVLEAKKNGTYIQKPKENLQIKPTVNKNENIKKFATKFSVAFESDSESNSESDLNTNSKKLSLQHPDEIFVYIPSQAVLDFANKYDINHNWADDEYWGSDSDDE